MSGASKRDTQQPTHKHQQKAVIVSQTRLQISGTAHHHLQPCFFAIVCVLKLQFLLHTNKLRQQLMTFVGGGGVKPFHIQAPWDSDGGLSPLWRFLQMSPTSARVGGGPQRLSVSFNLDPDQYSSDPKHGAHE